jgi:serine/threonine protein kinase
MFATDLGLALVRHNMTSRSLMSFQIKRTQEAVGRYNSTQTYFNPGFLSLSLSLLSEYHKAPELFRLLEFSPSTDVYSFGIVMWQLLTFQKRIYSVTNSERANLEREIIRGKRPSIPATDAASSSSAVRGYVTLMEQCWQVDHNKRPAMRDAISQLKSMRF